MRPSTTHVVLIPSYNPGVRGLGTVRAARAQWDPVWVIVDGSTDGSAEQLAECARSDPQLRVLRRARNGGKGAALFDGLTEAHRLGFYINLITSGVGLTQARAEPLKAAGLDHIQLSFHDSTRADCLSRLHGPASGEYRQPMEHGLFALGEKPLLERSIRHIKPFEQVATVERHRACNRLLCPFAD